ncbi:MAG: cobyrinic acid a,c-diamide synthase [Alcanivorax sp.]|jgi:cobyrinic acid a,c-diamide synthase|uniref:cobyrinate a,c-diamide synthase n=1 Tax=unclassified Ketobacter TaxID=2639109 RepID=UPI000C8945B3|nr:MULTISPECIES: cobyrinate a,c-diamide synthase [unclassified Ketobacter]MAA59632.1 cobyrinic acid a,c-diamide synthase [Pseudomonadales bacterium]TNC87083.1 MAG: cobyrinic acid a,c-diamide synthase [Alcanivorax sp.]HCB39391.1 cobyrinate a,c-diamide synthase [Gammaproteobacteria bacterium]MCK5791240.1 cobyrinate a,c-diamide synthase [Ketobacter sp.]RLT90394.1 MAG: cobyrinate a,c-diamide synthase [Ketobacter sp. GenoA1]
MGRPGPRHCVALLMAAPASGQGKTTITAGLARLLKRQGKRVRVFKAGPDYLDPQILQQASAAPVLQLDLWMAGEAYCRQALYDAAAEADLILVEGVMGMYDGEPSSADLAALFQMPLAIVMDVAGMAQTAAALAQGLATYRDDLQVAGLIANQCGSQRHRQLIADALPPSLPLLAALPRESTVQLPERHLGLVQAQEIRADLEQQLEAAADWLQQSGILNGLPQLPPVAFYPAATGALPPVPSDGLAGTRIAIARDVAFSFIYDANVLTLQQLGAEVLFFSPLNETAVPQADALWLPGGYPELHAEALAANVSMTQSMRDFVASGKPVLAECGGFLYCLQGLTDLQGKRTPMLGVLPGEGRMRDRGGCQGMQSAPLPEGEIRGHAHHRSMSENTPAPLAYGRRQRHPAPGEAIYRQGSLTATYLHLFFGSNPQAVARLFKPDGQH